MVKDIVFLSLLLVFVSKNYAQEQHHLNQFDWLIGTWERASKRGAIFEKWIKVSEETFEGDGFRIVNGDTIVIEFLRLEQFGDAIFYTAKVAENKYPVAFRFVAQDERGFVFENPGHDFPQRIIYQQKPDGILHAHIEGEENGRQSGVDFLFKKVK